MTTPSGGMGPQKLADALDEIAHFRRLAGKTWPARTYTSAAKRVREFDAIPESQSALQALPGIGEKLALVIWNLATTGTDPRLEKGRRLWPNLTELEQIRGVGPKKALFLYREHGVTTLTELKAKIDTGEVPADVKFMKNLEFAMKATGRTPRESALRHLTPLLLAMRAIPGCHNCEFAGSLRRGRDTVGDVDILFSGTKLSLQKAKDLYREHVDLIDADGPAKMRGLKNCGKFRLQVDLLVVPDSEWGSSLAYFTGSTQHNILLRQRAISRGYKLSEHGLADASGHIIASRTEQEIYDVLEIPYHPPELRERNLLTAEEIAKVVKRVEGDWHSHTTFSDGKDEPEELIRNVKAAGMVRFGVTDHYRPIDNHTAEDFKLHKARCKAAGVAAGVAVSVGLEVDVNIDGSLFGESAVIDQCDYVIASVHAGLDNNVVERLKKAADHPKVRVLGHPTTRILGYRAAAEGDWAGLFEICAANNVLLEINGGPSRLDLSEDLVALARSKGCRFVLCSDAHRSDHLGWLQNSLRIARRSRLESRDLAIPA